MVHMPRSYERGINYIISRNLRFQLINTPLVALFICLYRHFMMSSLVESNLFSLSNYLETLAIIAFLSFAIGLYWRFKFRNKYLAMELEETKLLNEELKKMQEPEQLLPHVVEKTSEKPLQQELKLTGTTNESVMLHISHLLFIEAVGNYVKVCHLRDGHLVNLGQVEQIISHSGSTQLLIKNCHESLPVSRSNMAQVKAAIKRE